MENKEKIISLWFDMWLKKQDLGIADIFSDDAVYIESWGPKYKDTEKIKHWFTEWNTHGNVLAWDIKQYFHKGNQTVIEWYFKNTINDGKVEAFDGVSIIKWTEYGKIFFLKEFGCNINNYDPYQDSLSPQFSNGEAMWF